MLDRRKFIKNTSMLGTLPFLPNFDFLKNTKTVVRTAHIGVGGMGKADLDDIASHKSVEVVAICDVDSNALNEAGKAFPNAKVIIDDLRGDGDHYAAKIIAEEFRGKTRVQQHQMVYNAMGGRMGKELHALALNTSAPKE